MPKYLYPTRLLHLDFIITPDDARQDTRDGETPRFRILWLTAAQGAHLNLAYIPSHSSHPLTNLSRNRQLFTLRTHELQRVKRYHDWKSFDCS